MDLGTLGGTNSTSTAMNASGAVVGFSDVPGDGARHAFIWTAAGGMIDLGTLGGTNSTAEAINDSDEVVGFSDTAGNAGSHAFLWRPLGGMVDLGTLGGNSSYARAITPSGEVVGSSTLLGFPQTAGSHAFTWTVLGGMTDLGTLGGSDSFAAAVSSSGQVVGSSSERGNSIRAAFSWTATGGMVNVGSFEGSSAAEAVNASGQIVGGSSLPANNEAHAFSWTPAGGLVDLGTLGGQDSFAEAVNDAGQVVGFSSGPHGSGDSYAFSWTAAGGMVNLGTLGGHSSAAGAVNASGEAIGYSFLPGDGAVRGVSWTAAGGLVELDPLPDDTSSSTSALNDRGQIAGVSNTVGGPQHAVLWNPQEPQTIVFTSTPPAPTRVGDTYTVGATGGGSGNPVLFSVDPSSTAGACTISGAVVSFTGLGRCVIDADQAGNGEYLAAGEVQQTVLVAGPEIIGTPSNMTVEATGPSGAEVTYLTPIATDAIDGTDAVQCTPQSGSGFPLGGTTVTCTATDSFGISASTTFTVTVGDTTAPAISGTPADLTVQAASSSGIAVSYLTPTATDLVDGGDPVACAPASGTTFALGSTTVTCTATDAAGNSASTSFAVTVELAPSVLTPPASETVYAGQTATFTAVASGSPSPTVHWQRSTDGGITFIDISGATSDTLSFLAESSQNQDRYRAVFLNIVGSAISKAAKLTVKEPTAPAVTTDPADQTVAPGHTTTFHAAASGTPAPSVQWQESADGGASFNAIPGATAKSYAFEPSEAQSGHLYRAVFTNVAGSVTTAAAALTVQVHPTVTTQPVAQSVSAGQTATFSAVASGTPAPTIQWQVAPPGSATYADIAGATATSYSFTASPSQNKSHYRAAFTNNAGTATTHAVALTVTP